MTPQDASVAEVRRRGQEEKSSLHPPIRGVATSIYLRKEGTGVKHTETRGLTPQEETRHTPLFRIVLLRTLSPLMPLALHFCMSVFITRRYQSYRVYPTTRTLETAQ